MEQYLAGGCFLIRVKKDVTVYLFETERFRCDQLLSKDAVVSLRLPQTTALFLKRKTVYFYLTG